MCDTAPSPKMLSFLFPSVLPSFPPTKKMTVIELYLDNDISVHTTVHTYCACDGGPIDYNQVSTFLLPSEFHNKFFMYWDNSCVNKGTGMPIAQQYRPYSYIQHAIIDDNMQQCYILLYYYLSLLPLCI